MSDKNKSKSRLGQSFSRKVGYWRDIIKTRTNSLLARRPHRSLRLTRRRDYVRSLRLPGYYEFTVYVFHTVWRRRWTFLLLAVIYMILYGALVNFTSEQTYADIRQVMQETSEGVFSGQWGEVGKAGLLLVTIIPGVALSDAPDAQKIFAPLLGLMVWLTTVWLLRAQLAGQKPRLRDGLYHGGAPLVSTMLVGFVVVFQLIPVAVAALGFAAASSAGYLDGVEGMLFWIFTLLLTLLSLYWITSSLIAMVVVTLPGMYPLRALKTAGDLVIGRRLRILLRFGWAAAAVAVAWMVALVPVVLFDMWAKSTTDFLDWFPLVPFAVLAMSSLTVVWMGAYIYLLYRKVVDDDARPA